MGGKNCPCPRQQVQHRIEIPRVNSSKNLGVKSSQVSSAYEKEEENSTLPEPKEGREGMDAYQKEHAYFGEQVWETPYENCLGQSP